MYTGDRGFPNALDDNALEEDCFEYVSIVLRAGSRVDLAFQGLSDSSRSSDDASDEHHYR